MHHRALSSPLVIASLLSLVVAPIACAQSVRMIDDSSGSGSGGEGGGGQGGNAGMGGQGGDGGGAGQASSSSSSSASSSSGGSKACEGQPDFTPCQDGFFCTEKDVCLGGVCTAGPSKICPSDGNACQVGSCNEASDSCTLIPVNNGGFCDDGDPCTELGTCFGGMCTPGPTKDCSFLNGTCSVGVCDPVQGCIAMPQNDGTFCDDGQYCTVNDTCQAGTCTGSPNPCGAPADICMIAACDEINDTCSAAPGNDGAMCNDGNICTMSETCAMGKCGGGAPANQGVACDDKNACTTGEICNNGACSGGSQIVACASNDGCCPAGCTNLNDADCKQLRVGVLNGFFYTDGLRAHLASQQFIQSAVVENDCSLASLQKYDVVILHGNMDCFDPNAFNTYVQNGGGLIATPWIFNNNGGLDCLPVSGTSIGTNFSTPLNVTVTNAADPLLQGVVFNNGDMVGYEEWTFTLKAGASSSVIWNGNPSEIAVAKWPYGNGRAVYLDFHYITSDCSLASSYAWGKQLAYNATLWAGKAL